MIVALDRPVFDSALNTFFLCTFHIAKNHLMIPIAFLIRTIFVFDCRYNSITRKRTEKILIVITFV